MVAWLHRLIEPTETTSLLRRRWTDIGAVLVSLVVIGLAAGALLRLSQNSSSSAATVLFWLLLFGSAFIMVGTTNQWARFVPALFLARGALQSLWSLAFGFTPPNITARELVGLLFYSIMTVGLTWRFARARPAKTTLWDRVGLTLFTLASLKYVVDPSPWPAWPLAGGLTALFVAWLAARLRRKPRGKKRAPPTRASAQRR